MLICTVIGGDPNLLYPTSKGAIIQMTRAMAAQHGKENVRVNCVCPGMAYTPMVAVRGLSSEQRRERVRLGLLEVEGSAWDVAYGESFLPWMFERS